MEGYKLVLRRDGHFFSPFANPTLQLEYVIGKPTRTVQWMEQLGYYPTFLEMRDRAYQNYFDLRHIHGMDVALLYVEVSGKIVQYDQLPDAKSIALDETELITPDQFTKWSSTVLWWSYTVMAEVITPLEIMYPRSPRD